MAIYCHEQFNEPVSIKRIRQLRIIIQNELRNSVNTTEPDQLAIKEKNYMQKLNRTLLILNRK